MNPIKSRLPPEALRPDRLPALDLARLALSVDYVLGDQCHANVEGPGTAHRIRKPLTAPGVLEAVGEHLGASAAESPEPMYWPYEDFCSLVGGGHLLGRPANQMMRNCARDPVAHGHRARWGVECPLLQGLKHRRSEMVADAP